MPRNSAKLNRPVQKVEGYTHAKRSKPTQIDLANQARRVSAFQMGSKNPRVLKDGKSYPNHSHQNGPKGRVNTHTP